MSENCCICGLTCPSQLTLSNHLAEAHSKEQILTALLHQQCLQQPNPVVPVMLGLPCLVATNNVALSPLIMPMPSFVMSSSTPAAPATTSTPALLGSPSRTKAARKPLKRREPTTTSTSDVTASTSTLATSSSEPATLTTSDASSLTNEAEDLRLGVPSDLLESADVELKSYISSLSLQSWPLNVSSNVSSDAGGSSPLPSTSKDQPLFTEANEGETGKRYVELDDGLQLHDLVALETMDEEDTLVCPEDLFHSDFVGNHEDNLRYHRKMAFTSDDEDAITKQNRIKGSGLGKKSVKSTTTSATLTTLDPNAISNSVEIEQCPSSDERAKSGTFDNLSGGSTSAWSCTQCKASFDTGSELLGHLNTLQRSKHKCISCHLIFEDPNSLQSHVKSSHPSTRSGSAANKSKGNSCIEKTENGSMKCVICNWIFEDPKLAEAHADAHSSERCFECSKCGKRFAKARLLRNHFRRHLGPGDFECSVCNKRFYAKHKLDEHMRVHTGDAPLSCDICGKSFKRHSNLSEHKKQHLPPSSESSTATKVLKELFCAHCGQLFHTKRDLDWHVEAKHARDPHKCSHCGQVFVHASSLTRHVRLQHESNFVPESKKKSNVYAKCPLCDRTFYKTSINKHIRVVHQGERPYKCDVCQKSFVTKHNLEQHQWQHRGVLSRPFKCHLCDMAYVRKSQLDAHLRAHKGIKPFVCNECGLTFASKSNWQRHVNEHQGQRAYECPHCHKRFSRPYYLTDHLKVHTGERPFSCEICGKLTSTRSNYNSHMKTHAARELVNSEV